MSIKINRARRKSGLAAYPATCDAVAGAVPPSVAAALTSAQLADLYRAFDRHWHRAIAHAEREVCENGFVWDASRGCGRDLMPG